MPDMAEWQLEQLYSGHEERAEAESRKLCERIRRQHQQYIEKLRKQEGDTDERDSDSS